MKLILKVGKTKKLMELKAHEDDGRPVESLEWQSKNQKIPRIIGLIGSPDPLAFPSF